MVASKVDREFDEIVSAWDERLCCQTAQTARPCRNPAAWVALGPCFRGTVVCTLHKNRFVRRVLADLARSPRKRLRCPDCGGSFPLRHFVHFRRL